MSLPLEIALFCASLAIVVFVVAFLVALAQTRRQLEQLTRTLAETHTDIKSLLTDTRTLVQTVTGLSQRADRQLADVEHVVHTVRDWSDRADAVARNFSVWRHGISIFLQTLLHRNQTQTQKEN